MSIWAGVGNSGTPMLVGHGVVAPVIEVREHHKPIHTDFSGSGAPFDRMFVGDEAKIQVELVRYREATVAILQSYASTRTPHRGTTDPGDIGTLLGTDGQTYVLWLKFGYAFKPVFQNGFNGPLMAGYRFIAATLGDADVMRQGSASPRKIRLTWYCIRALNQNGTANGFGSTSLVLYDFDVSALPFTMD